MTALGVDIGGSSVKLAVLAPSGRVASARSSTYHDPTPSTIREAIEDAIGELGLETVSRVGLCLPGRVDAGTGEVLAAVNASRLVGARAAEFLPASVRAQPITMRSDAEAAAFDVWTRWGVRGRLLAISIGTGVGASVLDEGAALRVSGASPGHVGQIDVGVAMRDGSVPIGPDGGRGSLEAYIGLPALRDRFAGVPDADLPGSLSEDDPAVLALARALRIAHAVYRPMTIALLGGVGIRLTAAVMGALRARVSSELTSIASPGWIIRQGDRDDHAAVGVARLAVDDA